MISCYLCSTIIKEKDSATCPRCGIYFCNQCVSTVDICVLCGSNPTRQGILDGSPGGTSGLSNPLGKSDKRQSPRKRINTTIEYYYTVTNGGARNIKVIKAVTKDISTHGLCIYTMIPLAEGQKLEVLKSDILSLRRPAVVRWVKRVDEHIYRAGLMFA